jgi:hypothetical protein
VVARLLHVHRRRTTERAAMAFAHRFFKSYVPGDDNKITVVDLMDSLLDASATSSRATTSR